MCSNEVIYVFTYMKRHDKILILFFFVGFTVGPKKG